MINELNYYSFRRLPIRSDLFNYFDDQENLEQTVRTIQNKVELYLGE